MKIIRRIVNVICDSVLMVGLAGVILIGLEKSFKLGILPTMCIFGFAIAITAIEVFKKNDDEKIKKDE